LQAAIGGKIIARSTINPLRKDVLANATEAMFPAKESCWINKRRQKKDEGIGSVSVPQEAFLAVLKRIGK
jgi:GTP-binding protein LepA